MARKARVCVGMKEMWHCSGGRRKGEKTWVERGVCVASTREGCSQDISSYFEFQIQSPVHMNVVQRSANTVERDTQRSILMQNEAAGQCGNKGNKESMVWYGMVWYGIIRSPTPLCLRTTNHNSVPSRSETPNNTRNIPDLIFFGRYSSVRYWKPNALSAWISA